MSTVSPGKNFGFKPGFCLMPALSRVLLSVAFLCSGIPMLLDPHGLMEAILAYDLVGPEIALAAAFFLPCLEVLAAIALWIPATRRAGHFLIGAMLGSFLIALASAWWRGLGIDCGCWHGLGFSLTVPQAVMLDAVLVGLWWNARARARPGS